MEHRFPNWTLRSATEVVRLTKEPLTQPSVGGTSPRLRMLPRRYLGRDTMIVIPAQAGIEGPRASRPRHVNSRAFAVDFLNREYARMDANVFPKSNPSSKPDRAAPCCSSLDSRLRGNDVRVAKLEVLSQSHRLVHQFLPDLGIPSSQAFQEKFHWRPVASILSCRDRRWRAQAT